MHCFTLKLSVHSVQRMLPMQKNLAGDSWRSSMLLILNLLYRKQANETQKIMEVIDHARFSSRTGENACCKGDLR